MKNQKTTKPRKPRAHTGKRASHYDSVLKILRAMYGYTQAKLAELCGVSATKISSIERGNTAQISVFEALAEFFKVSLDGLVRNDIKMVLASLPMDVNPPTEYVGMIDVFQKHHKTIGKKGEKLVLALEKAALEGTPYANAVTDAPAHEAEAHFDVYSFTLEGVSKHIEVKSTNYACNTPFSLSAKEYEFLQECIRTGKIYELHRVYGLKKPETAGRKIYTAQEVLEMFKMEPSVYEMCIKEEYKE